MMRNYWIVTAAALALTAQPAWAGKSQAKADDEPAPIQVEVPVSGTPDSAVRALYVPYMPGGDERLSAFDNDAERAKRFSANLTKELKDYFLRQEKAGEPGGLDFDPIVNGQDYKIGGLTVRVEKAVPGKSAVVIAEFKNFDEQMRVKYDLVFEGGAWKVDGIASLRDPVWNLRAIMKAD
jgi:hypothetical protein